MRKIVLKAGGVLYDDQYFYIVYRENHNDYSIPKWRAEEWEIIRKCAFREIEEETSIKADIVWYCGEVIYTTWDKDDQQTNIIVFFLMKAAEYLNSSLADDVSHIVKVERNDPDLMKKFTYESDLAIISKAIEILQNNQEWSYIPLYIAAEENKLPEHQHQDLETIVWTAQTAWLNLNALPKVPSHISFTDEDIQLLKSYIPSNEQYSKKELYNSIHGIFHTSRVIFYYMLLQKLLGSEVKKELLIASSLHDTQRETDKKDTLHSDRAAEYFLSLKNTYGPVLDYDEIYNVIKYHNIDYTDIPTDVIDQYGKSLDTFKCADALDRYRLPKKTRWPDFQHIKIKEASGLNELCLYITVYSELLRFIKPSAEPLDILSEILESLWILK